MHNIEIIALLRRGSEESNERLKSLRLIKLIFTFAETFCFISQ